MDKVKNVIRRVIAEIYYSDLVRRAFHTFWQTFLVVWVASDFLLETSVILAAGGAGLSAAKSIVVEAVRGYRAD